MLKTSWGLESPAEVAEGARREWQGKKEKRSVASGTRRCRFWRGVLPSSVHLAGNRKEKRNRKLTSKSKMEGANGAGKPLAFEKGQKVLCYHANFLYEALVPIDFALFFFCWSLALHLIPLLV
jgi:hypothetical protein